MLACMTKREPTTPLGVRVPEPFLARLDALAEALSTSWRKVTRSDVARAAMEHGIEPLEAEARERRGR